MQKSDLGLWTELENAHTRGLIKKLEEVSSPMGNQSPMRIYGTRVWFRAGTTSTQVSQVREYIRSQYNLNVSDETPITLIIWEPTLI